MLFAAKAMQMYRELLIAKNLARQRSNSRFRAPVKSVFTCVFFGLGCALIAFWGKNLFPNAGKNTHPLKKTYIVSTATNWTTLEKLEITATQLARLNGFDFTSDSKTLDIILFEEQGTNLILFRFANGFDRLACDVTYDWSGTRVAVKTRIMTESSQ